MKQSNYNFVFYNKNKNNYLIYNSFSNSLAEMSLDEYRMYKTERIENYDEEFKSHLYKLGVLIDKDKSELDIIRFQAYKMRYDNSTLALTIAPHSGCNFRCIYCFENTKLDHGQKMSKKVADDVIKAVTPLLRQVKRFEVNWFGGEPTLALDVIEYLSQKFIKLCEENKVIYSSAMITNGYLINQEFSAFCRRNRIISLQITIDGDETHHNQRRILHNGNGTYEKIINNIIQYGSELPQILLRVNVDKVNKNSITKLEEVVKENGIKNVMISPGMLFPNESDLYEKDNCFNHEEFSDVIYQYCVKQSRNSQVRNINYPQSKSNGCGSVNLLSAVINADGRLYKCWEEIGEPDYSYGSVSDGLTISGVALKYLNFDITKEKECKACKYLPLCMGGCNSLKKNKKDCCIEKYKLEDIVLNYANQK